MAREPITGPQATEDGPGSPEHSLSESEAAARRPQRLTVLPKLTAEERIAYGTELDELDDEARPARVDELSAVWQAIGYIDAASREPQR